MCAYRSKASQPTRSWQERFWAKVDQREPTECWLWTGRLSSDGYGRLVIADRMPKQQFAHRLAWELANGPIPPDLLVRHFVCANPPCVNPAHLLLGTKSDNAKDAVRDTGWMTGEKHPSRIYPDRVSRGSNLPQARITEAQVVEMRQRWATGRWLREQLAIEYGLSVDHVSAIVHGRSWTHVPMLVTPRRSPVVTIGTRHGQAKLREVDIPVIRSRLAAGERPPTISKSYGVSAATIYDIERGATWVHVV